MISPAMHIRTLQDLERLAALGRVTLVPPRPKILIGMATCGQAAGATEVLDAVRDEIARRSLDVELTETGCIGWCSQEPLLDVQLPGKSRITYGRMTPERARKIVADLETPHPEWALAVMPGDQNTLTGEHTAYSSNGNVQVDGIPLYAELPLFKHQ